MNTRSCCRMSLVLVALSLLVLLVLPAPARAADYGAVYLPATAPNPPVLPTQTPESFLDGLTLNKVYFVKVVLTNTGTLTWEKDGPNPFRLAYHWAGPAPFYEGDRTELPYDVAPKSTVTVDAILKTPSVPGTYTLQWDMVHEGITWFSFQQVPTADQIVGIGGKVGFDDRQGGDDLYMSEYCKFSDCDGEADASVRNSCFNPKIEFGPGSAQQGSFLYITGCGFSALSELVLILGVSNLQVPLQLQGVYEGLVAATVPVDVAAPDQKAFLMVRRKDGVESNKWPLDFKSVKETKQLSSDHIQVISCSDSADANYCNDAFSVDLNFCCVFDSVGIANPISTFAAISSYHQTDGSLIGDSGTDVYHVDLAPGWELTGQSFATQVFNGGGWIGTPKGLMLGQGQNSATIFVPWSVGGNSTIIYYLDLYATGPKGTDP